MHVSALFLCVFLVHYLLCTQALCFVPSVIATWFSVFLFWFYQSPVSMAPYGLQDEVPAFLAWPRELSHQPLQPPLLSPAATLPCLSSLIYGTACRLLTFPASCFPAIDHAVPAAWNALTLHLHLVHLAGSHSSYKTPLSHYLSQNWP